MNFIDVEKFSFGFFLLAVITTIIPFLWVSKKDRRVKLYIIPFIFFFFIYSGIGVAWENADKSYLVYYFIWMIFFSMSLYFIIGRKRSDNIEGVPRFSTSLVTKHASFFLYSYIGLKLLTLFVNGKIMNLVHPPSLDIFSALAEEPADGGILYYISHIVFIFYFVSLYKYRHKVGKLFLFLFFPFYIDYAASGYIARSTIMAYLIIYFVAIYFYNPSYRKWIIRVLVIGVPLLAVLLSFYTFLRRGAEVDVPVEQAIKLLLFQETSYPAHFVEIKKMPNHLDLFNDYIQWLTTLPLPGFLKDTSKDYFFNAIFTERLYGIIRDTQDFYILLPGVVNEGIFIFGTFLYPLHAIILGLFVGCAYRIVGSKDEFFLFLYISVFLSSLAARAGTVSAYPVYLKDLLMYEVIIFMMSKFKIKKRTI